MPNDHAQPSPTPPSRSPLAVAIVCKNNETTITRTLESVRDLATEIIAIDSGSTDSTKQIITDFIADADITGQVIDHDWLGHVRTKQLALTSCTAPWVLCLDSDESVEPDLAASIADALSQNNPSIHGYRFIRKIFYRNRFLNHAWQPEYRLRLVRNDAAAWGGLDPHDKLCCHDRSAVRTLPGTLRHDSFQSFAEHFAIQQRHALTMARSLHARGVTTSYASLLISPPGAFLKQLILKRSFLDGYPGWLAAASSAAGTLMKHAILLELTNNGSRIHSPSPPPIPPTSSPTPPPSFPTTPSP